jgi:hypothetical protein
MIQIATGLPHRARACMRGAIGEFAGSSFDRRNDRVLGGSRELAVGGNGLSAGQENARRKTDYRL